MANPEDLLGEDKAELLASVCAAYGELWLEAKSECDFQKAHQLANDVLLGTLDEQFDRFVEEESAQNEDRADIQTRNLEHHIEKQRETILNTIEKLKRAGKTKLIPANEGRLKALEERYKRQKIAIDSRRTVNSRPEDICVSVISVV